MKRRCRRRKDRRVCNQRTQELLSFHLGWMKHHFFFIVRDWEYMHSMEFGEYKLQSLLSIFEWNVLLCWNWTFSGFLSLWHIFIETCCWNQVVDGGDMNTELPTIYTYVRSTDGLKTSNSQTKVRCDQRVEQEKERCKASFCCCMLGARWDPNVESAICWVCWVRAVVSCDPFLA